MQIRKDFDSIVKDIEQDKKTLPLCRGKEWKHVLSGENRHKMSRRYEKIDQNTSFAKWPSAECFFMYKSKFLHSKIEDFQNFVVDRVRTFERQFRHH